MMRLKLFLLLLLCVVVLAACAAPGALQTPQPTERREATATQPAPTATPRPTETAAPSDTPVADATVSQPADTPPAIRVTEEPAPWDPRASDAAWEQGPVFLDDVGVLVQESDPPQVVLTLVGSLPTPCHQLRVQAAEPDAQNRIEVQVYTVVDPGLACIQVIQQFDERIPLGTFAPGTYTLIVNGEQVTDFTV